MTKGDYLYDAEVIIINPENSDSSFTVYQMEGEKIFGARHIEPGTTITRTVKINQDLLIVNNRSKKRETK